MLLICPVVNNDIHSNLSRRPAFFTPNHLTNQKTAQSCPTQRTDPHQLATPTVSHVQPLHHARARDPFGAGGGYRAWFSRVLIVAQSCHVPPVCPNETRLSPQVYDTRVSYTYVVLYADSVSPCVQVRARDQFGAGGCRVWRSRVGQTRELSSQADQRRDNAPSLPQLWRNWGQPFAPRT